MEAVIAGAVAQLQQAERDVQRYTELVAKNATTVGDAQQRADPGQHVARDCRIRTGQRSKISRFSSNIRKIRAPISGRISAAHVKVGNFVRPGDTATARHHHPDGAGLRDLHGAATHAARTCARRSPPRARRSRPSFPASSGTPRGQVTMIENTVDSATGMVAIRATMPNDDEMLWPGTLVTAQLTLAHRAGGHGSLARRFRSARPAAYVFVVENGVANVRPVKVARTVEHAVGDRRGTGRRRDRRHRRPVAAERTERGCRRARREGRVLTMTLSEALHPPAGPDDADHRVVHRVRRLRLPAAAGLGAAARRLPDHRDHRDAAGREPGDHGGIGRLADRAAAVDHRRHQRR